MRAGVSTTPVPTTHERKFLAEPLNAIDADGVFEGYASLFGEPDHDAELIDSITRGATAGMFCAGEIGPVGARSFVHGFTASVALFRDAS